MNRDLALLAVFFNVVSLAVEAATALALVAALLTPDPDATSLAIDVHGYGYGAALVFFGCASFVFGYLIYKSQYLPRASGGPPADRRRVLSREQLRARPGSGTLGPIVPGALLPAFVGEAALCLWLLVKGVDADRCAMP